MPSDNLVLNAGSGGATVRTLGDAGGEEWPASVTCYATTVSAGANVLQIVTPSYGLPVQQQGTWTVTGAGGTFPVTGNVTAAQGTATNLLCTASQGGTWSNTVTQATAASLNATVVGTGTFTTQAAQSGTWTVQPGNTANTTAWLVTGTGGTFPVTGTVTANAGTNMSTAGLALETGGNLASIVTNTGHIPAQGQALAAASLPVVLTSAQMTTLTPLSTVAVTGTFWQGTQPVSLASAVTVAQPTAASLNATVVGTGTFATQSTVSQGTAGNLLCTASQGGTWNVGTVTTVSTVSALTSITNALPAGTNLLGQISAGHQVGSLYNGTTAVTPQYAAITASSSGTTTIVALSAGKKIYILRWSLTANGSVNMNWQSHTTTTTATGLHYMTQFATAGGSYCPAGIFATASGEALDINLSAAVAVGGELTYVQF